MRTREGVGRIIAGLVAEAEPRHNALGQPLAAPASERECVQQKRTDMLVDLLQYETPRAVQSGLDRFRLDAEKARSFLDAHALDDPRHEDDAVDFGQGIGCLPSTRSALLSPTAA